jgi:hypothetical protein
MLNNLLTHGFSLGNQVLMFVSIQLTEYIENLKS